MVFATAGRGNVRGNDHPNAHVAKRCRRFPNAIMIANLAGVFARGNPSERALSVRGVRNRQRSNRILTEHRLEEQRSDRHFLISH